MMIDFELRPALESEVLSVAFVFRQSRLKMLGFLPELHTFEEDIQFFKERVFPENRVVVAELTADRQLVGFIAYKNRHIDHLYVLPEFTGKGVGFSLLNEAKAASSDLKLWVFQANKDAVAFYKRNGFSTIEETEGEGNEEKLPDYLMQWSR